MNALKTYRSHKTVRAAKIRAIEFINEGSAKIAPDGLDLREAVMFITLPGYRDRFKGDERDLGYYVRYQDGYESWSPTKAFEEGYTLQATDPQRLGG